MKYEAYRGGDENFRIRTEIQTALMMEGAPSEEDDKFDDYIMTWINRNSDTFRKAFSELESGTPNLVSRWRDDRENVKNEIRKIMSGQPGVDKAA